VVKFLHEHGAADDVRVANKSGLTPLHAASSNGHLEVVKFLHEHGAADDVRVADTSGCTPLHAASTNGHLEVIKFLHEHGAAHDVRVSDKNGCTPLFGASDGGHLDVVKFLFECDVAHNRQFSGAGDGVFTASSSHGYLLNAANSLRQTPLHAAFYSRQTHVMDFLLQQNARTDLKDCYGRDVWDWARSCGTCHLMTKESSEVHEATPAPHQYQILRSTIVSLAREIEKGSYFELGNALLLVGDVENASVAYEQLFEYDSGGNVTSSRYSCDNCFSFNEKCLQVCLSCATLAVCKKCMAEEKPLRSVLLPCRDHPHLQVPREKWQNDVKQCLLLEYDKNSWLDALGAKYSSRSQEPGVDRIS
jgi:ankyrin repeat protein